MGAVKMLLICRPVAGIEDPVAAFGPHLAAEVQALRDLQSDGVLLEAYTPGRPGAVLVVSAESQDEALRIAEALPLHAAGLLDVEIVELHPVPGLGG